MRRAVLAAAVFATAGAQAAPPAWRGHANSPQHTARAPAALQAPTGVKWKLKIDPTVPPTGDELNIHYAGPVITGANTVIIPVRGANGNDWSEQALNGSTGAKLWTIRTDYQSPGIDQSGWVTVFPHHLTAQNVLYFAGAGGSIWRRNTPDAATGGIKRLVFYGLSVFKANQAALTADVTVTTPITADGHGNIFFGFTANGGNAAGLVSGLARISATGVGSWVSAAAAAPSASGATQVAYNCAPALSADGGTVYVAVNGTVTGSLLALDSTTLATTGSAALTDPASGQPAWLAAESTSSPTVGPDGDVYFGVLESPFPDHNDRGWLLHFDATLKTQKIPGSFGWDDTATVVPASMVPSYHAKGGYLLMTKYNNYAGIGTGDGKNRIAILDPNASQPDAYLDYGTGITVNSMREVATQLGQTPFPGGGPGATYEWCINSSVVDPRSFAVIAGSEDGHVYSWNLKTNTLTPGLSLNAPRPEPYTPSEGGPDGTIYSINNGTLYAIGN